MNCKKIQYCKKASVKIGGLRYDFLTSSFIFSPVEFCKLLLPLVWGFWLCMVVTDTELEEKSIPLLVLFLGWQKPVHRSVHWAQVVQIARVTFSGVPFWHRWISLPFLLKGWGEGGCQVVVWCTLSLVLAQIHVFLMLFLLIQLFSLKTGSIITQIMNVWSSNQQWLVY